MFTISAEETNSAARTTSEGSFDLAAKLFDDTAGSGMFCFDRSFRITVWSRGMERATGVPERTAVGQLAFELFPSLVSTGEDSCFRAALEGRRCISSHTLFVPSDGSDGARLSTVYSAHFGATGEIAGGVGVVSEMREAQGLDDDGRERVFGEVGDAAPILLWTARQDTQRTFFNRAWLEFTGRAHDEEWGIGWTEGVYFEDLGRYLESYVQAFNFRTPYETEFRLRRQDGRFAWVLERGAPSFDSEGAFTGFIGFCLDITDRKSRLCELVDALSVKDEFLDMVSHELRTPITALQLQVERLRREASLEPTLRDSVTRISSSTRRLAELIESILQFSRIERGRLALDVDNFDLARLVAALAEELAPAVDNKGLELRVRSAQNLPVLSSDPRLVRLVLFNLLNNAIKFTEGGVIEVQLRMEGGQHCMAVRDTGRGIAPEAYERIFLPFEKEAPPSEAPLPGIGLGLALVRSMTAALRGRIEVESQLGEGSTFTVRLPSLGPSSQAEAVAESP